MDQLSRSRPRFVVWPFIVLAGAGLLVWLVYLLMHDTGPVRKYQPPHITQVMLPPPPPPPPPPPKPQPPKEEKLQEPKPFEAMKPQPAKAPDSALTAPPGPGANNFGLQPGDGSGTRIGGQSGGSPFAGYAVVVQRGVQQLLQRNEDTRKERYSAVVALWVGPDGTIQRSQIVTSAGKPEIDAAIVHALQGQSLQAPPADLPQPINLRIGAIAPG